MNHNWTPLLGYRRDESLGRSGDDFGLWGGPDDAREIRAELRVGGTVSKRPVTLRRRDGSAVETLLSAQSRFVADAASAHGKSLLAELPTAAPTRAEVEALLAEG